MFRPPVRLEKWIAYDGALGADLLVRDADADDGADDDGGDDFDFERDEAVDAENGDDNDDDGPEAFGVFSLDNDADGGNIVLDLTIEVEGAERSVTVTMPGDADSSVLFPFLNYRDANGRPVTYFTGGGSGSAIQAGDLYFEISGPDGGSFGFYSWDDVQANMSQFIQDNNIGNSTYMMFVVEIDGVQYLQEFVCQGGQFRIASKGGGDTGDTDGGLVEFERTDDGGFRFHLLDNGRTTAGNALLNSLFSSITFTSDGSSSATVGGFDVTVYHRDGVRNEDNPNLFSDDHPDGMYNPLNDDVTTDSTDSDFKHVTHDNLDPDPGPTEPDPDGDDDIVPPVIPPSPGDGDDGGDDSGDDSGEDGDDGELGLGEGDPVYIFRRDDEAPIDDGDDAETETGEDAAPATEARSGEEKAPDGAAAAELLSLTRDMEFLLTAVRNEKEVLLGLIGRLQTEYLARDFGEYGELRDYLRRLFDMGRREENTVNRIIDAMNREMRLFRALDPFRRDGMLTESVRELIDSAERRSGEMAAFSQAVEAVADMLSARRENGLPPPSEAEASALFAAKYGEALDRWQERAERIDPMGREFTAARRVAESVGE